MVRDFRFLNDFSKRRQRRFAQEPCDWPRRTVSSRRGQRAMLLSIRVDKLRFNTRALTAVRQNSLSREAILEGWQECSRGLSPPFSADDTPGCWK